MKKMRYQTWLLLFGAIFLIGAAFFVRIRTVPPKPSLDDETLWNLAVEQARLGDAERALQIAMQISDSDNREIALQNIADIFVEQGNYQNALYIVRFLPDPYLRILYFDNIVQSGKLPKHEAENLIEEAEQTAMQIKVDRQRKFAWLAVCRMWMQTGEIEKAWQVAQNLPKTQLRHRLWGELAVLFAKRDEVDRALKIAAQLPNNWEEESGQPTSPFGLSIPRKQHQLLTNRQAVLKAIAETLAQQGKVDEAEKIAQTLESEAVRSQVLDALANARKRVGMPPFLTKAAEKTLKFTRQIEQQLGTHGLFSPLTKPLEEQVILSKALNKARKLKTPEAKVARLVQISMQFPYSPKHKETVAAILAEATHYAREIKSLYDKVRALEQIAMCWERIGEREKAQSLIKEATGMRQRILEVMRLKCNIFMEATKGSDLTELKEVIKRTSDPIFANMLLEQTVVELSQRGQVEKAVTLVNELVSKEYQRQVLIGRIAWKLAELGKVEDALVSAQRLPTNFDKALLYHKIAEVLRQKGQKERAFTLLNKTLSLVSSLPKDTRKFALAQVVCSFARLGEIKKALEVLSHSNLEEDESFRFEFAIALAEGGDFETALKFAKQLSPERHGIALHYIASIAEQRGNKELAQKLRLEARSIAPVPLIQRR